ncbi:MAG: hypothetical protein U9O94_11775 [Nanoarchaeota archaeon]|nr:hypothetical protein [Nanoarchaeota archaeon]
MKNKIIRGSAMLLAVLVVMIPIYSSLVFASVSEGYIYGGLGINGYYRSSNGALADVVYVNVTASISDDQDGITPSQFKVNGVWLTDESPASCTDVGGGNFICQIEFREITSHDFNIRLHEDNNGPKDSEITLHGSFDEYGPTIELFDIITPYVGEGDDVVIKYRVKDTSNSDVVDKCSGVKELRFSVSGSEIYTEHINSLPFKRGEGDFFNSCTKEGEISLAVSDITSTEGDIALTLVAYDNLDNPSEYSTKTFAYDNAAPSISSLNIMYRDGKSLNYFGDNEIRNSVVGFEVTDQYSDIGETYVDVSGFNVDNMAGYDEKLARCSEGIGGRHSCNVTDVIIKLNPDTTSINVSVNASDVIGNSVLVYLSKLLSYDNIGPVVNSVRTNWGNGSYIGDLNNITVEFNEPAGVYREDIRLDLSNINPRLGDELPRDCFEVGNGKWGCYYDDIRSNVNDGEKIVTVSGVDRLGNIMSDDSFVLIVDKVKPAVVGSNVGARGAGGVEAIDGAIKTGDKLSISVDVRESNGLRAYADFSNYVTSHGDVSRVGGQCTRGEGDLYSCQFTSDSIDVPNYIYGSVPLVFVDDVGNVEEYTTRDFEVFKYADVTNPNYWNHHVTCSPKLVDRQITTLIDYKVMCSILLEPITADQSTVSIGLGQCKDNIEGSTAYIQSHELLNDQIGSNNPYLLITLSPAPVRVDEISINCPLGILSRVENDVMKNTEIENITIDIEFYNMPLGEYSESIEKQIRAVEKKAAVGAKYVGSLRKMMFFLEKTCGLVGLVGKLQAAKCILAATFQGQWGTAAACDAGKETAKISTTSFYKYCSYISCTAQDGKANEDASTGEGRDGALWGNWLRESQDSYEAKHRGMTDFLAQYELGSTSIWPESPKESLFLSIATGCVPGIINGIERWRQIYCNYGVCLADRNVDNIPIDVCKEQRKYLICKNVAGEAIELSMYVLPINWMRSLMRQVSGIVSDPLSSVFGFLGLFCPETPGSVNWACSALNGIALFTKIGEDITLMGESFDYKLQGDMCEVYFERLDELDNPGENVQE